MWIICVSAVTFPPGAVEHSAPAAGRHAGFIRADDEEEDLFSLLMLAPCFLLHQVRQLTAALVEAKEQRILTETLVRRRRRHSFNCSLF